MADIPFEKLESRLKKSRKRPLINRNNSVSIKKIYFQRKKFYNQVTFKVNCKSLTVREITDKIIRLYEKSKIKFKNNSERYSIFIMKIQLSYYQKR